jgi:hypothetical protein
MCAAMRASTHAALLLGVQLRMMLHSHLQHVSTMHDSLVVCTLERGLASPQPHDYPMVGHQDEDLQRHIQLHDYLVVCTLRDGLASSHSHDI